jgi:osmoprotectant transport system substrate-binding protein
MDADSSEFRLGVQMNEEGRTQLERADSKRKLHSPRAAKTPLRLRVLWVMWTFAASGCVLTTGAPPAAGPVPTRSSGIVVAAFDFSESELLAQLYGQALSKRGLPVQILSGGGSREVLEPALEQGLIDVVPEYQGALLNFLELNQTPNEARPPAATHRTLQRELGERGLHALEFSVAENKNEFVVTAETASLHGLRAISDLAPVASELVMGGPPECELRPLCLEGLENVYGLKFESFQAFDASGPHTVSALHGGEIDVALMFTTDPAIDENNLVVLRDDRGLQPSENVVPVVRQAAVDRYGSAFVGALDSVSMSLNRRELVELNKQVAAGAEPADLAGEWLAANRISAYQEASS